MMRIGLDVGSTTIKCVVLDDTDTIVYQSYERHFSQITQKMTELLSKIEKDVLQGKKLNLPSPVQQVWELLRPASCPLFRKYTLHVSLLPNLLRIQMSSSSSAARMQKSYSFPAGSRYV